MQDEQPLTLLESAYEVLDNNHMLGAKDEYRFAILIDIPTEADLFNLTVAEAADALAFRKRLIRAHPDVFAVRIEEARHLLHSGFAKNASVCCTKLLLKFTEEEQQRVIHEVRFDAFCEYRQLDESAIFAFLDDFWFLWELRTKRSQPTIIKRLIWQMMHVASDESGIAALQKLRDDTRLSTNIQDAINRRISEIRNWYAVSI